MGTSFGSFEIARSGMSVSERGLFVTGHNISNVNTTGYVRQQAMITTGPYHNNPGYQLGLGADIQEIRQIRHAFIDNIYRQESTTLGYWEARRNTIGQVEAILGEPMEEGLQSIANEFWNSWQELSKEPESLTMRAMVRQRAENMAYYINHLGQQLNNLQTSTDTEITVRINEINGITSEIAALNAEIMKYEVNGDSANDYRDRRNFLVDNLSKLVDAEVSEQSDGQYAVTLGGYFLVNKTSSTRIFVGEKEPGSIYGYPKIIQGNVEINLPVRGGMLKGLLESRGDVMGYKGSLENGTPNTKADISIVVDVSDSSTLYLDNIKNNINDYINELSKHGIDYNLRLVTFNGNTATDSGSFGKDSGAFLAAVNSLSTDMTQTGNDFGAVAATLDGITDFRENANRLALVFTGESIGGDSTAPVTQTDIDSYNTILKTKGIVTSVVTNNVYFNSGDTAMGEAAGWEKIAKANGGNVFDIASADYKKLMTDLASSDNTYINKKISVISDSQNILPEIKQRLNALVNIMLREINYLHRSGKTLSATSPAQGEDLFVAINSSLPLEMNNIKLNDNLTSLANLVTSKNGAYGDNSMAFEIANLRYSQVLNDKNGTLNIDEFYQSLILRVGNMGGEAARIAENQQLLVASADNSRQAIAGVSMDEEMSNMMKYQFAYNASSRTINVLSEMLDTVINRLGLVGR